MPFIHSKFAPLRELHKTLRNLESYILRNFNFSKSSKIKTSRNNYSMSSPKHRHKALRSKSKSSSFDELDEKTNGPFKNILGHLASESPKLAERVKKVLIAAHYASDSELLSAIEEEIEDCDDKSIHKFIENMFKKAKVPHEPHDYTLVANAVKTMLTGTFIIREI